MNIFVRLTATLSTTYSLQYVYYRRGLAVKDVERMPLVRDKLSNVSAMHFYLSAVRGRTQKNISEGVLFDDKVMKYNYRFFLIFARQIVVVPKFTILDF